MKEYVFLLVGVSVISCVASMLSPDSGIRRYVALVVCLCMLASTVRPLVALVDYVPTDVTEDILDASESVDYESVFKDTLISANEESFCRLLKAEMIRDLGMTEGELELHAEIYEENGEYKLGGLCVELYGLGFTRDPSTLRAYVRDLLGVECEIIYS